MDLSKSMLTLDLDRNIIDILNKNNIFTIEELWNLKRLNLKNMGMTDSQINQITIKLQLLGIGLNKKIYDNDRLKI